MNKKLLVSLIIVIVSLSFLAYQAQIIRQDAQIKNFESCVAAGYPATDSYPPTCRTRTGVLFGQYIGNEQEMGDFITITSPRPNQFVTSPLTITGQAVGGWFFEGQFPVKVTDEFNNLLGEGTIKAKGDWMTDKFVPFSGTVKFNRANFTKGKIILQRDNPSGLPENEQSLIVPVKFE